MRKEEIINFLKQFFIKMHANWSINKYHKVSFSEIQIKIGKS